MTLIDYLVYHVVVLVCLMMVPPHTHMDHYRFHPVVFDDDDPLDMMMDEVMSNQLIPGRLMVVVDLLLVLHMVDNDGKNVVVALLHNDDDVMMVVVHDYTLQHLHHCLLVADHHILKNDDDVEEEDGMDNDLDYYLMMVVVDQHLVLYMDCIRRDHLCFEMKKNREYREVFHWQQHYLQKMVVDHHLLMMVFHLLVANHHHHDDVMLLMLMAVEVRTHEDRSIQELDVNVVAAVVHYRIDYSDVDGDVMKRDDVDETMMMAEVVHLYRYYCFRYHYLLLLDNLSFHDSDQDPDLHFDVMTWQPQLPPPLPQKDLPETSVVDDVTVKMVVDYCYWTVVIVMPMMTAVGVVVTLLMVL